MRLSEHLRLEVAHAVHRGHQPDDTPPLQPTEPVPGCSCPRCTAVPADHPTRRLRPRRERRRLPVEEARSVPILDVCEQLGLDLRQVGRSWRGPCPMHGGEGPNFAVLPDRGLFKCFVCDETGNGIDLWMRVRGVPFTDAVRELARGCLG